MGYFVKWKGYDATENSWVDEQDIGYVVQITQVCCLTHRPLAARRSLSKITGNSTQRKESASHWSPNERANPQPQIRNRTPRWRKSEDANRRRKRISTRTRIQRRTKGSGKERQEDRIEVSKIWRSIWTKIIGKTSLTLWIQLNALQTGSSLSILLCTHKANGSIQLLLILVLIGKLEKISEKEARYAASVFRSRYVSTFLRWMRPELTQLSFSVSMKVI